uniref:Zinc finger/thioredoxin putative domain-containing protein n=1 Tax=candidate division WOR-3 bacterium TaxID=2052148 RepID=A0A7C6AFL9_UNCW3
MIVECSSCHSKYNVDESKIPATGVKVKCPKCQNVILIKKEIPKPIPETPRVDFPPPPPKVEPPPAPKVEPPVPPEVEPPPTTKIETPKQVSVPEPPVSPPPETKIPEPPVVKSPDTSQVEVVSKPMPPPQPEMSEEDKKWHERARRLAKALASDLVLYNQEKVEQGLRDGTLVQLLGAEIKRSWEYYCQQIPKHIVENSDYFREQLNKIVGKGKEIFK